MRSSLHRAGAEMYSDLNALEDHLEAEKKRLSATANQVLAHFAYHASEAKGEWFSTYKTLARKLGAGERAIQTACKELISAGFLNARQPRRDKPTIYAIATLCPPGCQDPKHKAPNREWQNLPYPGTDSLLGEEQNLLEGSGKNSQRGGAKSAAHIKEDKETKKGGESASPFLICNRCKADQSLNPPGVIHAAECPELVQLMKRKAWQITQEQSQRKGISWHALSAAQQQRLHLEDMNAKQLREAASAAQEQQQAQATEIRFQRLIDRELAKRSLAEFPPNSLLWLKNRFEGRGGELTDQEINLAAKQAERGTDLPLNFKWLDLTECDQEEQNANMANS